jgi:NitT/TauT family transport system ATP-binding protein
MTKAQFQCSVSPARLEVQNLGMVLTGADGVQFTLFEHLTFTLDAGTCVSIVGPSGAGKTTLLQILAGLMGPTAGEAYLNGKLIVAPTSDRVLVFQEDSLFPWYTVEENIGFPLALRGSSDVAKHEAVETALSRFGLERQRHVYPKYLSGGEKKRTELARAFSISPAMLLLDEPFIMQDIITKRLLHEIFLAARADIPVTTILVTHDLAEAALLSDRILFLSGPPSRIRHQVSIPFERSRTVELQYQKEFAEFVQELLVLANKQH